MAGLLAGATALPALAAWAADKKNELPPPPPGKPAKTSARLYPIPKDPRRYIIRVPAPPPTPILIPDLEQLQEPEKKDISKN